MGRTLQKGASRLNRFASHKGPRWFLGAQRPWWYCSATCKQHKGSTLQFSL